jgi:hypothetical protein
MGNWRTVVLQGTLDPADLVRLRERLQINDYMDDQEWEAKYGPLSYTAQGSLFGLNNWPATTIDARGNLFERDCSVQDVAEQLVELVRIAPSLALKVHCGGDWESETCIATITVDDGVVVTSDPEVDSVAGVSLGTGMQRLLGMLEG